MKAKSAPLDDVFAELQITLDDDGRFVARLTRGLFTLAYRVLKLVMLSALRVNWPFPELLAASGISAELAALAQLRRVDSRERAELIGRQWAAR